MITSGLAEGWPGCAFLLGESSEERTAFRPAVTLLLLPHAAPYAQAIGHHSGLEAARRVLDRCTAGRVAGGGVRLGGGAGLGNLPPHSRLLALHPRRHDPAGDDGDHLADAPHGAGSPR